jgi:hypothetical protein
MINPTTIPQIDKAFEDLCNIIVKTTEEIVPKRKIKKRKPKLQIMSEDISSSDNKSVSHWIMFDFFFHV